MKRSTRAGDGSENRRRWLSAVFLVLVITGSLAAPAASADAKPRTETPSAVAAIDRVTRVTLKADTNREVWTAENIQKALSNPVRHSWSCHEFRGD